MSQPSRLTAHERVIRQQLEEGRTFADIARGLRIPVSTLKSFVSSLSLATKPRYATDRATRPGLVAPAPVPGDDVSREEMLEAEVRELRQSSTKARKAEVAQERIIRAVESATVRVKPSPLRSDARAFLSAASSAAGKAHHRQVLLLSDFHGGEVVDRAAVNGLNRYDWQVMVDRVDEVINAVLSHQRYSPALTGLDVIFNGDMCGGINHQELAETNEFGLAEQAIKMGYVQADIVRRLAEHVADVRVLVMVGNHPRLPIKPAAKRVHENGDWIAGVVMEQALKDLSNVAVTVPRAGAAFWEVAGLTYYVSHGDGVRSSMPGVPWGGLARRFNEIRKTHASRQLAGWWVGHFHQANVLLTDGVFMNGSLKGADEWCLKNFGGGGKPAQLLLTFDERKSRLTDVRLVTPTAGLED